MSIEIYYLKTVLPAVQAVAKSCGYAIGIHGSMKRDFDLMAMPWTEEATDAETLIEEIRKAVSGHIIPTGTHGGRWDKQANTFVDAIIENPVSKPHGRLAWAIHLGGGSAYLDVSVMPRISHDLAYMANSR